MKFHEMIPALKEGKKIRRSTFGSDCFVYMSSDRLYFADGGEADAVTLMGWLKTSVDWEVLHDPMTDEEIIEHFKHLASQNRTNASKYSHKNDVGAAAACSAFADAMDTSVRILKTRSK